MKTRNLFLHVVLALSGCMSWAGSGSNLECTSDQRPSDGDLISFQARKQMDDTYTIYYTQLPGGFHPGPSREHVVNQAIATGLKCAASKLNSLIRVCSNEDMSSEFNVNLVLRSEILPAPHGNTSHQMVEMFEVVAKAPMFPRQTFLFNVNECVSN